MFLYFANDGLGAYVMRMKNVNISEKLLEIAEAAGLTEEQLRELLGDESDIPQDLMDLFEKVAEKTTDVCEVES